MTARLRVGGGASHMSFAATKAGGAAVAASGRPAAGDLVAPPAHVTGTAVAAAAGRCDLGVAGVTPVASGSRLRAATTPAELEHALPDQTETQVPPQTPTVSKVTDRPSPIFARHRASGRKG